MLLFKIFILFSWFFFFRLNFTLFQFIIASYFFLSTKTIQMPPQIFLLNGAS